MSKELQTFFNIIRAKYYKFHAWLTYQPKNFSYWLLKLKYGGKDNIPKDVLQKHLAKSISISPAYIASIRTAAAIEYFCKVFQINVNDCKFFTVYGKMITFKLVDPDELMLMENLLTSVNIRQSVFTIMVKNGDIPKRKLDYFYKGEFAAKLDKWIAEGLQVQ